MEDIVMNIIIDLTDFKELKNNKDIDLLENEVLDSLAFIEIIEKLNNEFDIELQPTLIPPETWRNIHNICEYINKIKNK